MRRGESTRWWNCGWIESLIYVRRTFVTEKIVNRLIHLQTVMNSYWEFIILGLSSLTGKLFDPWNQSLFVLSYHQNRYSFVSSAWWNWMAFFFFFKYTSMDVVFSHFLVLAHMSKFWLQIFLTIMSGHCWLLIECMWWFILLRGGKHCWTPVCLSTSFAGDLKGKAK